MSVNDTLKQLRDEQKKIAAAIAALEALEGIPSTVSSPAPKLAKGNVAPAAEKTKRKMSAAARKRISDAAKARWARERAAKSKK